MIRFIAFILGLVSITPLSAQQVITLLKQGLPTQFFYTPTTTLNDVVTLHAAAGDTIILPGGTLDYGGIDIQIPITIIGAGFHQNGVPVTQKTIIPSIFGSFNIYSSAAGSSFHGIDFDDDVFVNLGSSQLSFTRCEFTSVSLSPFGTPDPIDVSFRHCLFRGGLAGGESQNINIDNCVFESGISFQGLASNNIIRHCLFLNADLTPTGVQSVTYRDNLFVFAQGTEQVNNLGTFDNNGFTFMMAPGTVTYGTGNYNGNTPIPSAPTQFPAGTPLTSYSYNFSYQLVAGMAAANAPTTDGTEVGIYGGLSNDPWKDLAIPFNPHWLELNVPGTTNATGVLAPVHIEAEAQQD